MRLLSSMGEGTGASLGGFYIFWGAPGRCFFLPTLPGRSTSVFHAKSKLAHPVCSAFQVVCSIQSGTEGIPCWNRYLSIFTFCRLRSPGRRGAGMLKNQS